MATRAYSPARSAGEAEIKRPKTAWGLFLEEYKKTRSNTGGIGKFNELQKAASSQWKNMTADEKEPWIERERLNNEAYIQRRLEQGGAGPVAPSKRKRVSESKGYRRAFQFFVNEHRQQNPMYWSLFSFNQAQRELSAAWNAIPTAEKQKWFMLETGQDNRPSETKSAPSPTRRAPQPIDTKPHHTTSMAYPPMASSVGAFAAAGMVPIGTAPPMHPEYYPGPTYPEYMYTDGLSPHFYSGEFAAHPGGGYPAYTGRVIEQHPHADMVPQSNMWYQTASRSHSDSDLQHNEKKRKVISADLSTARCESSYSDGTIISPQGYPNGFTSGGTYENSYLDQETEDGHTFDLVTGGAFLDADHIFR